jgi:hypothetical protein
MQTYKELIDHDLFLQEFHPLFPNVTTTEMYTKLL